MDELHARESHVSVIDNLELIIDQGVGKQKRSVRVCSIQTSRTSQGYVELTRGRRASSATQYNCRASALIENSSDDKGCIWQGESRGGNEFSETFLLTCNTQGNLHVG